MTDYNIDFLIAGLVFLIFLLIHFQRYKKLNNISGRTFWFLIIAGIFDIIFDLLSSILLVKSNPAYNSMYGSSYRDQCFTQTVFLL